MSTNLTVDYVRHLLKRNGCRAQVSIVPVSEIDNEIGVQREDVQDERAPMRMAASTDIAAKLADLGVRVVGGREP
jgi:hypothetical protein